MNPLVSIITVVLNRENTISRVIDSIIGQTYKNIEYIFIDGSSTDNTLDIAKNKLVNSNLLYKIVSEKDNGIYDAMNKGIKFATGEIIGIINSDDWYEPDAIFNIVNAYNENGVGVYYGIERRWEDGKEVLLERTHHENLVKKNIPHPTVFVPKFIYDKYGMFNLNYRFGADIDLMIRLFKEKIPFYPMDIIIANFSLGGASSSNKSNIEGLKVRLAHNLISEKYYKRMKIKYLIIDFLIAMKVKRK